ncbi:hypothetical protein [Photobacterium swingsii]|uniref:hypothetical protein n=1 Tax=Photobacterium swingsii TaxID=680026 RepID=UPI0040697D6F
MIRANLSASNPIKINMTRIDNTARVSVNGEVVYDKFFNDDPPLNEIVEVTKLDSGETSEVLIQIINAKSTDRGQNNPWHLAFTITGANQEVDVDVSGPHGGGLKEEYSYVVSWD